MLLALLFYFTFGLEVIVMNFNLKKQNDRKIFHEKSSISLNEYHDRIMK